MNEIVILEHIHRDSQRGDGQQYVRADVSAAMQ